MSNYFMDYSDEEEGWFCERCGREITEHEDSTYKGLCSECFKRNKAQAKIYQRKRDFREIDLKF